MKRLFLALTLIFLTATTAFALPQVQGKNLTWDAPTTYTDGSPLPSASIGGYKVYWRSNLTEVYTDGKSKDVGKVLTTTIQNVTGSSTTVYYFVVTTYDIIGTEGPFSNEVDNKIPLAPGAGVLRRSP